MFIFSGVQLTLHTITLAFDDDGFGMVKEPVEDGRGRKLEKMGMHAQDTAELIFEDCRVPAENRLGEENKGFYYLMERLQPERILAIVQAQAMAEAMIDMTVRYTKERKQFGERSAVFNTTHLKLLTWQQR